MYMLHVTCTCRAHSVLLLTSEFCCSRQQESFVVYVCESSRTLVRRRGLAPGGVRVQAQGDVIGLSVPGRADGVPCVVASECWLWIAGACSGEG